MMPYCLSSAASALMLEPADLKSILEAFFRSAFVKIEDSRRYIQAGDLKSFSLVMHAFKGLALSLHMIRLGELATAAERVDSFSPEALPTIVDQMEAELLVIRKSVDAFYQKGLRTRRLISVK